MMVEENEGVVSQPKQACPASPTLTEHLEEILDDGEAQTLLEAQMSKQTGLPQQEVPPLPNVSSAGGNTSPLNPLPSKNIAVDEDRRCETPPRKQSFSSWPKPPQNSQASWSSGPSKMELTPEKQALFKRIKQLEGHIANLHEKQRNFKAEAAQEMEARLASQQQFLDLDF